MYVRSKNWTTGIWKELTELSYTWGGGGRRAPSSQAAQYRKPRLLTPEVKSKGL